MNVFSTVSELDTSEWTMTVYKQQNLEEDFNCGIFVCLFMERISRGVPLGPVTKDDIVVARQSISFSLLCNQMFCVE